MAHHVKPQFRGSVRLRPAGPLATECSNACSNGVWIRVDFAGTPVKLQVSELGKRQMCGRQLAIGRTPLQKKSSRRASRPSPIRDSNSLGGTIKPQVRGLSGPISSVKSGHKCLRDESGCAVKAQLRGGVDALLQLGSSPFCSYPWVCLLLASNPVSPTREFDGVPIGAPSRLAPAMWQVLY